MEGMPKTIKSLLLFGILAITMAASGFPRRAGLWSRSAIFIWSVPESLTLASPDGSKRITIQPIREPTSDATTVVTIEANGRSYATEIGSWVNAEVAWSPDSKAFFVTYSDGGNVGTYHVKVFYVTPTGLNIIEPVPNGRTLWIPKCFDAERPNVAAIGWSKDSSRLLIVVQVPPHSSCASMGTFRSYEIALPRGTVVAKHDQIASKKIFAAGLGNELRDADDNCTKQQTGCMPPGLK
jgi:hypothetical protein